MPFDKGRDAHTRQHQAARFHLRQGMARVALDHKLGIRTAHDFTGQPLKAMEMAERHSVSTLQRWAHGYAAKAAPGQPSQVYCERCKGSGESPWHEAPRC